MAISDGINPYFEGVPTASGFKTKGLATMSKGVKTNGTTEVDVFGATNGFTGSVVSIKGSSLDANAAEILVYAGTPKGSPFSRTLIAQFKKDSGTTGAFTGSYVSASGAFTANGSLVVVSNNASGNAFVELSFTPL